MERALDLGNPNPLVPLTGYQTPAAIRRLGASRLEQWRRNRRLRRRGTLARTATEARRATAQQRCRREDGRSDGRHARS